MKNIYGFMLLLGVISASFGQVSSSTGVVALGTAMTIKIDLDKTNSLVTYTITGPDTKWFAIGLNASSMDAGTDIIRFGTSLLDEHLSGFVPPVIDTKPSSLTQVSNTTATGVRTVVATRPFDTQDIDDYKFVSTLTNLNIIWAVGPSTTLNSKHASRSFTTLQFKATDVLGTEDFATLGAIEVFPNPSKSGVFSVSKNNLVTISKIKVFDNNAKLLKSVNTSKNNLTENVDLSGMAKGIYFMEISNDNDKTVKKIIVE
jgi:hypothetical protein